jgi:hypothetical protein
MTCGNGVLDDIEEYFKLRQSMQSNLNFMDIDGSVKSFTRYDDVILHWFPIRKKYYILRAARRVILRELKIKYYKNIIRYIDESRALNMPLRKKAEMIELLSGHGYDKFCKKHMTEPQFISNDDLPNHILAVNATYNYLLGLSDLKKSDEGRCEFVRKLNALQADVDMMCESFPGANIWLEELDSLEKMIAEGQRTRWEYGNANKYTFD